MPTLQSHLARLLAKQFVGPKFRRLGESIPAWRDLDRWIIKNQRVPAGTEITPVSIDGIEAEWVRPRDVPDNRAIVYLHGGGCIMGSPATHRELAARISAAARAVALVPDYRLAPEHPFPAAMRDSVACFKWLLAQGYTERNVAIGGDSAGGGLTLQALIALRDEGGPLPAAAFCLSPVTDWLRFDGESYRTRADLDPLVTETMCRFSASRYVGRNDPRTSLLCPRDADLSGLPPLCIHVGDHEVLLSDSVRLGARARDCDVEVDLKVWPGMWHVFQSGARFVPEARSSIEQIGGFLSSRIE